MRKTDKKIDNQLRLVLTQVCEIALKDISGFCWLTHLVNYANFPNSLKIVCVFDSNDKLAVFLEQNNNRKLNSLIQGKLLEAGVKVKDVAKHIAYDTQQDCEREHQGKWGDRLHVLAEPRH
jgi:hypothetical protein